MKIENNHGEQQVGVAGPQRLELVQRPRNRDYFVVGTNEDDENLITIHYAIRSDIEQLQPIEFDIIFSDKINRIGTNYLPMDITNETVATTLTNEELEEYSLLLEYECEEGHLIVNNELLVGPGNLAGKSHHDFKPNTFKEPSAHVELKSGISVLHTFSFLKFTIFVEFERNNEFSRNHAR